MAGNYVNSCVNTVWSNFYSFYNYT